MNIKILIIVLIGTRPDKEEKRKNEVEEKGRTDGRKGLTTMTKL